MKQIEARKTLVSPSQFHFHFKFLLFFCDTFFRITFLKSRFMTIILVDFQEKVSGFCISCICIQFVFFYLTLMLWTNIQIEVSKLFLLPFSHHSYPKHSFWKRLHYYLLENIILAFMKVSPVVPFSFFLYLI